MALSKDFDTTLKTAKPIKATGTLSGSLDSNNRVDYYRFNTRQHSRLKIQLEGLIGNADLSLLGSEGKLLRQSKQQGKQSESITSALKSGSYVLQIVSRGKATSYQLKMSSSPATSKRASSSTSKILSSFDAVTRASSTSESSPFQDGVYGRSIIQASDGCVAKTGQ